MRKNMGAVDKAVRLFIAVIIAVLYYAGMISGTAAIILGVLAIIFAATSFISFCPLYLPFGIDTSKKDIGR